VSGLRGAAQGQGAFSEAPEGEARGGSMTDNPAAFFQALRVNTARLLGLDIDRMTPSQAVRVDRASSLRMRSISCKPSSLPAK
jgi:hypothetical protein